MFGFLKKKKAEPYVIASPVKGKAVPLSEVSDPTFGEGILGQGAAVIPSEGKVYAPVDGEVGMVFETLHAVSMVTEYQAEILIHVGLDTVKLGGTGFKAHVEAGAKVKKGDLLLEVDLEALKAAGYDTITPVVVCNTDAFEKVEGTAAKEVAPGEELISITPKA